MRQESTIEEWPASSLVYLRHPGHVELVLSDPETGRLIVVPVSTEQVVRLIADAATYLPALLRSVS